MNCVIRRASPKPVRHCSTQPSWACAGIWLCTKIDDRSGSMPIATQLGGGPQGALAQDLGVLLDRDRVQVGDEEERLVLALQVDPLPQRAEVVAEVEGVGRRLDAGQHARARPRTSRRGTVSSGDVVALGMGALCQARRPGEPGPGAQTGLPVGDPLGRVPACPDHPTLTDGTVTLRAHREDDVERSSSSARTR